MEKEHEIKLIDTSSNLEFKVLVLENNKIAAFGLPLLYYKREEEFIFEIREKRNITMITKTKILIFILLISSTNLFAKKDWVQKHKIVNENFTHLECVDSLNYYAFEKSIWFPKEYLEYIKNDGVNILDSIKQFCFPIKGIIFDNNEIKVSSFGSDFYQVSYKQEHDFKDKYIIDQVFFRTDLGNIHQDTLKYYTNSNYSFEVGMKEMNVIISSNNRIDTIIFTKYLEEDVIISNWITDILRLQISKEYDLYDSENKILENNINININNSFSSRTFQSYKILNKCINVINDKSKCYNLIEVKYHNGEIKRFLFHLNYNKDICFYDFKKLRTDYDAEKKNLIYIFYRKNMSNSNDKILDGLENSYVILAYEKNTYKLADYGECLDSVDNYFLKQHQINRNQYYQDCDNYHNSVKNFFNSEANIINKLLTFQDDISNCGWLYGINLYYSAHNSIISKREVDYTFFLSEKRVCALTLSINYIVYKDEARIQPMFSKYYFENDTLTNDEICDFLYNKFEKILEKYYDSDFEVLQKHVTEEFKDYFNYPGLIQNEIDTIPNKEQK